MMVNFQFFQNLVLASNAMLYNPYQNVVPSCLIFKFNTLSSTFRRKERYGNRKYFPLSQQLNKKRMPTTSISLLSFQFLALILINFIYWKSDFIFPRFPRWVEEESQINSFKSQDIVWVLGISGCTIRNIAILENLRSR